MNDIQRADIKTRRYFLLGLLLLFGAAFTIDPIVDHLETWVTKDPELIRQKIPILVSGIALAFTPLLFMGGYCWRLGAAVIRSDRFPSPGMKVIVDTPILRGSKARAQGRRLQLLGLLLSFSALAFPVAFWFILVQIVRHI